MSKADQYAAVAVLIRNIGPALAGMRAARGLSLDQAGDEMGLSRSTISRVENGKGVRLWCLAIVLEWMGRQAR